jgi:hypothetical protein
VDSTAQTDTQNPTLSPTETRQHNNESDSETKDTQYGKVNPISTADGVRDLPELSSHAGGAPPTSDGRGTKKKKTHKKKTVLLKQAHDYEKVVAPQVWTAQYTVREKAVKPQRFTHYLDAVPLCRMRFGDGDCTNFKAHGECVECDEKAAFIGDKVVRALYVRRDVSKSLAYLCHVHANCRETAWYKEALEDLVALAESLMGMGASEEENSVIEGVLDTALEFLRQGCCL